MVAAARFAAGAHFVGTIQVSYLCKHRVLEMVAATIIGDSVDVVLPTEVLVNDLAAQI